MVDARTTLDLVVALFAPGDRAPRARSLAAHVGVEDVVVLVWDAEVGAAVPAPGFPQTLRGGPAWRAFAAQAARTQRLAANVDLPLGAERAALALSSDGLVLVLLGDAARASSADLDVVVRMLPALAQTIRAERRALLAEAHAVDAADAAERARTLASALEGARAESAKLNAELREEHRRKDDFLAMLAHELRNPLAPLTTSIGLLRRHATDGPTAERHLGIMSRQVAQLSRLVEDLLDVSRVSLGRIQLRRARCSLVDVVQDAVEINRPLLDARRHRLHVDVATTTSLDVDATRLTQVFANLVHNAAKYTDAGGHIVVASREELGDVVVQVADDGIGMSADVVPRVFDLFAQAPVALDRAQGGLGIGLTLVRALVELHGGSVSAQSPGIGRGSTFTVRLPRTVGAAADARTEAAAKPAERPTRPLRVLVVDDNVDAADSIADLLVAMGHDAHVAYDGPTALARAHDLELDLVLLDIGLPGMDGYDVARRLRRGASLSTLLVALTGYSGDEAKREAADAGFDHHVVKPVGIDVLEHLVARAAAREGVDPGS